METTTLIAVAIAALILGIVLGRGWQRSDDRAVKRANEDLNAYYDREADRARYEAECG